VLQPPNFCYTHQIGPVTGGAYLPILSLPSRAVNDDISVQRYASKSLCHTMLLFKAPIQESAFYHHSDLGVG
jgi:hypothetical protein